MGDISGDSIRSPVVEALFEIERSLCLSSEIRVVNDVDLRATFEDGLQWMKRFVMRPHPNLGRKGAVCPFVQPAHEAGLLYFSALDCSEMSFDLFLEVMMHVPALYSRLAVKFSVRRDLLSLCIYPTKLPSTSYYKFIDCAHPILKPIFMNAGLMLGEFHPLSSATGAHSGNIFPLRADVPFFAIRAMAVHDILFIDRTFGSSAQRIHELECYLRWVRGLLSGDQVESIEARIEDLKSKLIGYENSIGIEV